MEQTHPKPPTAPFQRSLGTNIGHSIQAKYANKQQRKIPPFNPSTGLGENPPPPTSSMKNAAAHEIHSKLFLSGHLARSLRPRFLCVCFKYFVTGIHHGLECRPNEPFFLLKSNSCFSWLSLALHLITTSHVKINNCHGFRVPDHNNVKLQPPFY